MENKSLPPPANRPSPPPSLPPQGNMRRLTPLEELKQNMEKMGPLSFKSALPASIPLDKFIRTITTTLSVNPALVDCDRDSLYLACTRCAQDGLLPDGREAAIVPYKGKAQYLPMVGGILKKIRNSGEIASIDADIVHENDIFDYWRDEKGQHFLHRPMLNGERGRVVLVYSLAIYKDGGINLARMTVDEVEKRRASSAVKNGGPWVEWWEEMAKKTVVKGQSKYLPSSTDIEQIWKSEDDYESSVRDLGPVEGQEVTPKKRQGRMEAIVDKSTGEVTPPPVPGDK